MSDFEKTVLIDPVGFIEDSFTVVWVEQGRGEGGGQRSSGLQREGSTDSTNGTTEKRGETILGSYFLFPLLQWGIRYQAQNSHMLNC